MNRILSHSLLLILAVSASLVSATDMVSLPLGMSRHVTLKLMFQSGSVDDPADQFGITYLTARMLVESGTKSMTKEQIDEALFPTAARFSARIDKEVTVFTTNIHVDHLDLIYPIFRDLFLAPRWDEADFNRVKENALKEVKEDIPNNNDEALSKSVFYGLMYEGHPYGHLAEGTRSSLEKITLEQVKAHYAKLFNKNRLTIGIAGKYNHELAQQVKEDMDRLPAGSLREPLKQVANPTGVVARIISKEQAFGSAIFMGYPLKADRSSADFAALLVANSYLGQHRSSDGRLYKEMRGKRSLNYGDYSYMEWYPNGHETQLPASGTPRSLNAFAFWIRPVQIAEQFDGIEGLKKPELGNAAHSIHQAIRELDLMIKNGIPEADFLRMRTFMAGFMRQYVQSQDERLGYLMDSTLYGRKDYIEETIAIMEKLTVADVNAAIRKYLQAENFYVAIITDDSEAQKLADCMKTGCSAPIVYKPVVRAGLDEAILAEDKVIDAYKLNVTKTEVIPNTQLFQ